MKDNCKGIKPQSKLIITEYRDKIVSVLTEDSRPVQISLESKEQESILGNIYIGRVQNIVKNINAAFVEIAVSAVISVVGSDHRGLFRRKKQAEHDPAQNADRRRQQKLLSAHHHNVRQRFFEFFQLFLHIAFLSESLFTVIGKYCTVYHM